MNLNWLNQGKQQLIGVDINAARMKLLELSKTSHSYRVDAAELAEIPPSTFIDSDIKNPQGLSQVLADMHQSARAKRKHAAVAVPGSASMIKTIQMDATLNELDLEAQVWLEAGKHFPDLVEAISLDFCVLGSNQENPNMVDVLLIASRNSNVRSRVDALESAGLDVDVVDVDYYAYARAYSLIEHQLPRSDGEQITAMLNISDKMTIFIVLRGNEMIYYNDIAYNTLPIMQCVERNLEIDDLFTTTNAELENISAERKQNALNLVKDNLNSHISHFLQLFASAHNQAEINAIVLSGACALIPGIANFVEQFTGIQAIVANPLEQLEFANHVDKESLMRVAPVFMLCAGLALRGLSL